MYGATLTGPETRTTSPVRMERTDNNEAVGLVGIFPAGEGAGYAGGIVSSATDGIVTVIDLLKCVASFTVAVTFTVPALTTVRTPSSVQLASFVT